MCGTHRGEARGGLNVIHGPLLITSLIVSLCYGCSGAWESSKGEWEMTLNPWWSAREPRAKLLVNCMMVHRLSNALSAIKQMIWKLFSLTSNGRKAL